MPDLGWKPRSGYNANLGRDNDFVQGFTNPSGDAWPAGTVITLTLGDYAAWPATITGNAGSWNVDKTVVNALLDAHPDLDQSRARITYTDAAGLDQTLTTGRVNVYA